MVLGAQGAKLPNHKLADWQTFGFVRAVMSLAALAVVVRLLVCREPALNYALAAGVLSHAHEP